MDYHPSLNFKHLFLQSDRYVPVQAFLKLPWVTQRKWTMPLSDIKLLSEAQGNNLQQQDEEVPRCRSPELRSITIVQQGKRIGITLYVCWVWRRSNKVSKYRKASSTANGSHKCWKCRWYLCSTFDSDSFHYTRHAPSRLVDFPLQRYQNASLRARCLQVKSSKVSQNWWCVKWRKTQHIRTWCEVGTRTGRLQSLRCCTSRLSDVLKTDYGGI